MDNPFLENFEKLGKAALDSAKELRAINTKVYGRFAETQRDLLNEVVELSTDFLSTTTEIRNVQDLLGTQIKFVAACNAKLLAVARETADIVVATRNDYQTWFEKGLKVVSDTAPAAFKAPITAERKAA
jgi:phasin family protein